MSEELTLGQREIGIADALTGDELEYLEKNGVTQTELRHLLGVTNAAMTLDAAIGGVLNLKKAFAEGAEPADPRGLGISPPKESFAPPKESSARRKTTEEGMMDETEDEKLPEEEKTEE